MGSRNPLYIFVFRVSLHIQMIPSERDMIQLPKGHWDMLIGFMGHWRGRAPGEGRLYLKHQLG
jgi:hypothetical protein